MLNIESNNTKVESENILNQFNSASSRTLTLMFR